MRNRLLFSLLILLFSNLTQAFDEKKFAQTLGLELISEGHPYNFFGVSAVYANESMTRQLLVVSEVPGELKEVRIIKKKEFLIVEIPKNEKSYVSMAVVGINEEEIKKNLAPVTVWRRLWKELSFISETYASDCLHDSGFGITEIKSLEEYLVKKLRQGIITCLTLQREMSTNLLNEHKQSIKVLATNPGLFWSEKVKKLKKIKEAIEESLKNKTISPELFTPDNSNIRCSF